MKSESRPLTAKHGEGSGNEIAISFWREGSKAMFQYVCEWKFSFPQEKTARNIPAVFIKRVKMGVETIKANKGIVRSVFFK